MIVCDFWIAQFSMVLIFKTGAKHIVFTSQFVCAVLHCNWVTEDWFRWWCSV